MPSPQPIRDELDNDPLGRGYAGMTDVEAAADMNTEYRTRPVDDIHGGSAMKAVDLGEYNAMPAAQQDLIWKIFNIKTIDISSGFFRDALLSIFTNAAAPASRANLIALATTPTSRAVELFGRAVTAGDIERARLL